MPLSDIVSLDEHSLDELLAQDNPYDFGSWFLTKSLDLIPLAKLGELIGAGSYDALMEAIQLVGEPLPEGPWPHELPRALTEALRALTREEAARVSIPWSQIDEFYGGARPAELASHLGDLADFLRAHPGPFVLMLAL